MEQFLGEFFPVRITSVQSFGFFVSLDNTIEGLVHISTLGDDYYEYDGRVYRLQGRHTGRVFAIGDQVQVQLVKVDAAEAKIDFELV
jgi:ribonuclease R